MSQIPARRLADACRARRESLRITQPAAAKAGGIGVSTLRQIESAAQPGSLSRKTALGLDRALRWKPGSAQRILTGDEDAPEPLDTEGWPTSTGDWAAYVARREREAEDVAEVAEGARAALETLQQQREERGRRRLAVDEFSDGELIAELARRLAEAERGVTSTGDEQA
jgi:transcriptional regulator with XRE-family HTH domain